MIGSINKAILIGNLGDKPEVRTTSDNRGVANFSLATNETWIDKNTGEKKEKTEWHKIVVFNPQLVNFCKSYLQKGDKVYLSGQIHTRKWQDKNNIEKYSTEIVLQGFNCELISLSNNTKPVDKHNEAKANGYQQDDDCPF